ncbi:MAG TPA: hypothetical protein DDW43_08075 [Nitrosomonas sp.]|nr:hypothetical protein [Nitrosomonas sp.]
MSVKEPLKNVDEAVSSRQKSVRKRSLYVINEHFKPIFNVEMATQVVSQRFLNRFRAGDQVYPSDRQ